MDEGGSNENSQAPSHLHKLLDSKGAITGVHSRDIWLEKILQALQGSLKDYVEDTTDISKQEISEKSKEERIVSKRKVAGPLWPDQAIAAAAGLEEAAYDFLGTNRHKYNLKLRSVIFNLKHSSVLAHRIIANELQPKQVVEFEPVELKEGRSVAEMPKEEPPKGGISDGQEVANKECDSCGHQGINVINIISAGFEDKYQLQCPQCGLEWYGSPNSVATLTDAPREGPPEVGLNPLATEKFSNIEKAVVEASGQSSPRQDEGPDIETPSAIPLKRPHEPVETGDREPVQSEEPAKSLGFHAEEEVCRHTTSASYVSGDDQGPIRCSPAGQVAPVIVEEFPISRIVQTSDSSERVKKQAKLSNEGMESPP